MALFNRRQTDQANVPEEIREYYQTERRERTGIAWLLAFGTLLVTIALATGLFFGGRAIYRAAFDKKDKPEVAQNDNPNHNQPQAQQPDQSDPQPSTQGPAEDTPHQEPPTEQNNSASQSQPKTPRPSESQPESAQSQSDANQSAGGSGGTVAGESTHPIPNTGPGNVVSIFAFVTLTSYLMHRYILRSRTR